MRESHQTKLLGPVHTNPFSNENGAVLLRIRLSSTLQRRKRSPKTEPFENALHSGAIWKRCFLKCCFLVWTVKTMLSENGDVIKTTQPWVSKMADRRYHVASISRQFRGADILKCACVEFIWPCALRGITAFSKRYGVVVWTGENDTKTISVDANLFENGAKQLRFRLKTD